MARGKNSPALFEVIRSAQQKQKELAERQRQQQIAAELNAVSPAAALLRSPMYWFKGKQAHEAASDAPADAAAPKAVVARPPVESKPKAKTKSLEPVLLPVMREVAAVPASDVRAVDAEPAVAAEAPRFDPVPIEQPVTAETAPAAPLFVAPPPAPAKAFFAVFDSPAAEAARQVREEIAAQDAPAAEPMFAGDAYHQPFDTDLNADADNEPRQPSIHLNFNYTTAFVAGFAILVAFTVAYIIGTAGRADKSIAKIPTHPEVLNVRTGGDAPPVVTPPAPVPANDDDARAALPNGGDLSLDTLGKPIAVPTNVKRVVNDQYLVLMSFANEAPAKEMVKFLAQNGVAATAEKALPGYSRSWTSVVSVRGFERTRNNPAFDAYSATLSDLKQKYSPKSKFNKTFNIDVYTWGTAR